MKRVNITVPDEVKSRMDEYPENWSQVASTAFERRLVELGAMKGQRTAERLVLDLFIAERLFGWKPQMAKEDGSGKILEFRDENGDSRQADEVPYFSSDVKELDRLIRAASKRKIGFSIQDPAAGKGKLVLGFTKGKPISMSSPETDDLVPEAVCKVLRDLLS